MTDDEHRIQAWTNAIHCEGTRVVFDRRASGLRWKTRVRDFVGIAVPFLVAYLLGSDVVPVLKPYRELAVSLLLATAVLQGLLVVWSLLSKWDEELAYDVNSARESYNLKEHWKRIASTDVTNLTAEYNILSRLQALADARDGRKRGYKVGEAPRPASRVAGN